jgi:hypothetical protein
MVTLGDARVLPGVPETIATITSRDDLALITSSFQC